ncbi:hypothetical protein [Marinomonas rhizomae]|nr:hypothetical protein [Marinomonas rhizomae]
MTEFTATVATTDDTIDEADETFTLTVGARHSNDHRQRRCDERS